MKPNCCLARARRWHTLLAVPLLVHAGCGGDEAILGADTQVSEIADDDSATPDTSDIAEADVIILPDTADAANPVDSDITAGPDVPDLPDNGKPDPCLGKTASDCNDGIPCTVDACTPGVGCTNTPDDNKCSDGKACTVDSCTLAAGCVNNATSGTCDDGDACTEKDSCATGSCVGTALDCFDGIPCTVDSCVAKTGCTHVGDNKVCDDGKPCTSDTCLTSSGCVNANTVGPCDDGDACTVADTCASGVCQGTAGKCGDGVCACGETKESCGADCTGIALDMVKIAGGTFMMGAVEPGFANQAPVHQVILGAFEIERTEVTVAQYKVFYDSLDSAKQCTGKNTSQMTCATPALNETMCTWQVSGKEQLPLNCVDWYQAAAYCAWVIPGGRLPTEAEWEYAARSGGLKQTYAWGDAAPDCTLVTYAASVSVFGCGTGGPTKPCTTPLGNTAQGLCDMSGNVGEWTKDWFGAYGAASQTNPQGPASGKSHVARGGSFAETNVKGLSVTYREPNAEPFNMGVGFRCARTP